MAERGSAEGTSGRRGGRGLAGFLAVFEAIALAVQLQDVDVVGQSIEQLQLAEAEQVARTVQPFLGALPRHFVVFAQEGGQAQGVGGELLLSPQSVEIIKFGDPGSGR